MSDEQLPSPTSIPHLIATHILRTSSANTSMAVQDLAAIIGDVTIRTQILGASFLTVTVIDPDWEFQTSGILAVSPEGLLDTVEVNFPEGSDKWWRLCAINGSGDRSSANVTLTFEDRIVAYLRDHWGPKTIAPGTTTRAQFVKQLVSEVKATPIKFVCPSINEVQPVASNVTSALGQATVSTAIDQQNASITANKSRGVGHGAKVTVKGQPMSRNQIAEASTLIGVASSLKAGPVATAALMFAAIAESGLGGDPRAYVPNYAGQYGVLQGNSKTWPNPHDTVGMATSFLLGGKGFQSGGAIALSRTVTDPIQIAVRVEVPSTWPANSYATEAGFSNFLPEAQAIIAAAGGAVLGSQGIAGLAATGAMDRSQLTRGTPDNPDETSWDAIQRLARDVSWFAFTNASYFYYMDGYDLVAQKPTAYIELLSRQGNSPTNGRRWQLTDSVTGAKSIDVVVSPTPNYNFDNTSLIYRSTHTVKGKVQRKSRAAKPSTPSEIMINLVCPIDFAHAGDVFVFQGCGPMNGRWVVTDATRNCLADLFTQFTLEPPIAPTPEPQATTTSSATLTGAIVGGPGGGPFTFPLPTGSAVGKSSWTQDQGVDIAAPGNTPLFAVASGTVVGHGIQGFGPSAPILKLATPIQGQGYVYYGHAGPGGLAPIGAQLTAGAIIGSVGPGIVGISTGPHLEIGFCDAHGTPTPGSSSTMLSLLTKSFVG